MKRGAPDHPKAKHLGRLLKLKRYEVVGVMESLWHFTASYAKRGDVGRWTDHEIAAAIGWSRDPIALVDALVEAGLVDRVDGPHRLLVHDWAAHADQTVTRSQEVRELGFIGSSLGNASEKLANARQPEPKPEPYPKPTPPPVAGNNGGGAAILKALGVKKPNDVPAAAVLAAWGEASADPKVRSLPAVLARRLEDPVPAATLDPRVVCRAVKAGVVTWIRPPGQGPDLPLAGGKWNKRGLTLTVSSRIYSPAELARSEYGVDA